MRLHVINSWALANLIHPIAFALLSLWEEPGSGEDAILAFLVTAVMTFLVSLPVLFISYCALSFLVRECCSPSRMYLVWMFFAVCIVLLEGVVMLLITEGISSAGLRLCFPGMLAMLSAILIRYRQFFTAINECVNN